MVEELRKIILSKDELVLAMEAYRRAVPDFLPHGQILECQTQPDGALLVRVRLAYGSNNQDLEFSFKPADLLGPIIQFCVENNIMLPRNSRKCIKSEGDRFALYIAMESQQIHTAEPSAMFSSASALAPNPGAKVPLHV